MPSFLTERKTGGPGANASGLFTLGPLHLFHHGPFLKITLEASNLDATEQDIKGRSTGPLLGDSGYQ